MGLRKLFDPGHPAGPMNAGLFVLRVWLGLTVLTLHGWNKLVNFGAMADRFPDLLGIGSPAVNLALSVFAEVLCAALVVLGLMTRVAALALGVNMFVAFALAHGMRLTGQGNGELAFVFLAAFLTLAITGPGRYSLDALLFGAPATRSRHTDD